MGKKAVAIIGSVNEEELKKKAAEKLHQKKLRQGKGERVVDTTAESLAELEVVEKKLQESQNLQPQEPTSKTSSFKKSRVRSKPYQAAKSKVGVSKVYTISDAIKLLRDISLTKFDATVELHLVLKEKGAPKEVELPHSTGKTRRVAIADEATVAKIESGKIDFDVLYASPNQMGKLVKFAKVLGPKGLMPNPKNGTVVADPTSAIKKLSDKSVVLKTEKEAPLIHTIVGKLSASDQQLTANIKAILDAFEGKLVKVVLKSTMSPAIKIQV